MTLHIENLGELNNPDLRRENPGVFGAVAESGFKAIVPKTIALNLAGSNPARSAISEADFQRKVIKSLQSAGWLVHAERPARTKDGWITPVQGDAGFPDIFAIHPDKHQMLVLELKSEQGKLSVQQERWILAANSVQIIRVSVLRPSDWERIMVVIK